MKYLAKKVQLLDLNTGDNSYDAISLLTVLVLTV